MRLFYREPADHWEAALPLGNGRLGAMVWSGVEQEKISLNEDTLWSGYPNCHDIPGAAVHYKKAQQLSMEGKYEEAQIYLEDTFLSKFTQSYLPLGELTLELQHPKGSISGYERELDLDSAVARLQYSVGGVSYCREAFVSAPDQVLVLRLTADEKKAISFRLKITSQLRSFVEASENSLVLYGLAPSQVDPSYVDSENPIIYEEDSSKKGMRFCAQARVLAQGGTVYAQADTVCVEGADAVVILLDAETSFQGAFRQPYLDGKPHLDICRSRISAAQEKSFDSLYQAHVKDYQFYYHRVAFQFAKSEDEKPTMERLAAWEKDVDPGRYALLFQYGRYLMISSSRPGTMPTNLQGIWNQHLRAPWSSNFTININTEMNYWPAETANLSELHMPLLEFLQDLRITGSNTAREHYGARGFTAHHNTDIWALSNPVGEHGRGSAVYAYWPMSGGWLSAHAYEHYLFTNDKDYLREKGYPVIRDAARFYLDVLVEDENGHLIFAPSTSPENAFIYNGKRTAVSKTTAMTMAIVRETLENFVFCCKELGLDEALRLEAEDAIEKLPGYIIGSRGELLEWNEELEEAEPTHRHSSHMYPLYPGHEISLEDTPEYAQACRRTLQLRGDEGTGWALAWRVNLWARLQESEKAYQLLKKALRPVGKEAAMNYSLGGGCYANLFGAHPPFQIDSNFGVCAGIAEMLMQSTMERIILLPAVPTAFGDGSIRGLKARGGLTVSVIFSSDQLREAVIEGNSQSCQERVICYGKYRKKIQIQKDEKVILHEDDFV